MDLDESDRVGERIRGARQHRNLTQGELALKAGMKRESIYRIERGRRPNQQSLELLAIAMDLPWDEFISDAGRSVPRLAWCVKLRQRRRSLGLSLEKCAKAAGVSAVLLSKFERGMLRSARIASYGQGVDDQRLSNEGLARNLKFTSASDLDHFCRS